MFQQGDLRERTVLACGKDLWLRVGDFLDLNREHIEYLVKHEDEIAEKEKRENGWLVWVEDEDEIDKQRLNEAFNEFNDKLPQIEAD